MVKDRLKLIFDFFKHLSTLNIACILLMAGLIERVFQNPVQSKMVEVMFVSFVTSLLGCLVAMLAITLAPDNAQPNSNWFGAAFMGSLGAIVSFLVGLVLAGIVIAEQRVARQPALCYKGDARVDADDMYVYPIQNKSPAYDALISKMEFIVSDPEELAAIEKSDPRPFFDEKTYLPCDQNGFFLHGAWRGTDYVFVSTRETTIPKSGSANIVLRITTNSYGGNKWIKGRLVLYYDGVGSPLVIAGASVKAGSIKAQEKSRVGAGS